MQTVIVLRRTRFQRCLKYWISHMHLWRMQVYQREIGAGGWLMPVNASSNSSHRVTSLTASTTYQFYVRIQSYGKTDQTDIVNVTTGACSRGLVGCRTCDREVLGSIPGRVAIKCSLLGWMSVREQVKHFSISNTKVNSAFHSSGVGKSQSRRNGIWA